MSRLLGRKARKLKMYGHGPEDDGRAAFAAGKPIAANPYGAASAADKGPGHAWARGWKRAETASRKSA